MNNIIELIVEKVKQEIEESVIKVLEGNTNLDNIVDYVGKMVNNIGIDTLSAIIEELNEIIKKAPERARKYHVQRNNDKRTLITRFGELEFERTYYKNISKNSYVYILDELLGIEKYEKIEGNLKGDILDKATDVSYQKSSRIIYTSANNRGNTSMKKLSAYNISKSYGNKEMIKDISLEIYEGELVCLLRVSGVGKTTLFNVLSGLLVPDHGKVLLDGVDITGEAGHISYMLQKDLLLPYKTVLDNVSLSLIIRGENKKKARIDASNHFKTFGIDGTQKKYPYQLSGGMRQRAALLRTYLFPQDVALLDEPFSALDTITKGTMHSWYLEVMENIKLYTSIGI